LARIQSVKFSPSSDRLAIGGPEATLQLLETTGWSEVATFQARSKAHITSEETVDLIEFLPAGGWAAYLTDGRIRVWSSGQSK
jgi:WD40 repeat protein